MHTKGVYLLLVMTVYFLNRVCTGILAFEQNNLISYYLGNYDYYWSKRADSHFQGNEKKAPQEKRGIDPPTTKSKKA